ncbi:MAG TPA: ATP-binding protein [Chroococcidiopsis sp.]
MSLAFGEPQPPEERLTILVVDDDEVDRLAVRRALNKAGIYAELLEVGSYSEAIAILQERPFDCVMLDYQLPDNDGLALVNSIREQGMKMPLVVLTGQGDEQIAVDLMKAGASDYLAKSRVSPEVLSRILRNALRLFRAEMEAERANQQLRENNELLRRKNQELERQQQQIEFQNLKLQEASRLKSQFLATMSHELRTPLNAIIGFSQMLLRVTKEPLTLAQKDMVDRILSNGRNLLALISDILDVSKIEAGRLEIKPESLDIVQIVNLTVEELRSLAQEKNLSLAVELNVSNPEIYNDANRLRQILINLLSNAIKFTEEGGVRVVLNDAYPDQIAIAVHDTGIGIAAADIDKIFEPFQQIDQTTTRKYPGTGLGLAITDLLVKMMDGTITVESEPHIGSTFYLILPRRVASSRADITDCEPASHQHLPNSPMAFRAAESLHSEAARSIT